MVTYFVLEPPEATGNAMDRAERLAFVKDGFHWFAAIVPLLWLPLKRMWLEFFVFLIISIAAVGFFSAAGAPDTGSGLLLILQIVLGFEAGNLYSAALERRGWRLVGTVSGRTHEDCERRFFESWWPTRTEIPADPPKAAGSEPLSASPSWSGTALAQAKGALSRNPFARASG